MQKRVVVTGMGMVTPLGLGARASWRALLAGKSGVGAIRGDLDGHREEVWQALPSRVAALVPRKRKEENEGAAFDLEAFAKSSESRMMSLAMKFGLLAAEEALEDAQWEGKDEEDSFRSGVAVGMAMVDLDYAASCHAQVSSGKASRVGPYFVPRLLPNLSAGHIAIRHRLKGPNHSVSTACATGSHAVGDAFNAIRAGSADLMVCGGVEACVNPLVVAGFCRARALSTRFNDRPEEASRPFDAERDGFVIGEGAGILVLEELEHARRRGRQGRQIYGEMLGYGLSGDAFHVTAGREDGEGAHRAMMDALRQAPHGGISSALKDLWCINAHATSTPKGDVAEMVAVEKLLGGAGRRRPFVVSNKGNIGHLLGAAGSVESGFALLSLRHGVIPRNINLDRVDQEIPCSDLLVTENMEDSEGSSSSNVPTRRRLLLKNSFGFGGTNVSLLFSNFIP